MATCESRRTRCDMIGTGVKPLAARGLAALCLAFALLTASAVAARPLVVWGKQIDIDNRFGAMFDPGSPPASGPRSAAAPSALHVLVYFGRADLIRLLHHYDDYSKLRAQLAPGDALVLYIPDDMFAKDAGEFAGMVDRMFHGNSIFLYARAYKVSMMFDPNFWTHGRQSPDARLLGASSDLRQKVSRVYIDHEADGYCQPGVSNSAAYPVASLVCASGFPVDQIQPRIAFQWSAMELRTLSSEIKSKGFAAGILPSGVALLGFEKWDYGELLVRSGASYMIVQTQKYCSPAITKDASLATVRRAAATLHSQVVRHSLPPDAVAAQISLQGRSGVGVNRALDCAREFEKTAIWNIFVLEGSIPDRTDFLHGMHSAH